MYYGCILSNWNTFFLRDICIPRMVWLWWCVGWYDIVIPSSLVSNVFFNCIHDDVIKWKHFPRYWPFVRGIHRSPVNSPHKGQWRGALMFTLICAGIIAWVNNREAGDLRRNRAHYDVIGMSSGFSKPCGIGQLHTITVYGNVFWECAALMLSVIMYPFH